MSITTECMVVNLHRGMWEARKLDREKSREVAANSGAAQDAVNVNKLIIPKEARDKVFSAAGAIYGHYILHTVAWKDNGDRLLGRRIYMQFIEEHERLVKLFNTEADTFAFTTYPAYRARAQFRMAGLFKASDYPTPEVVRAKFYANLEVDAVTDPSHFLVKLDSEQQQRIREQMEANLNTRLTAAMGKVWQQLADAVEHYAMRMKETKEGGRLYSSTKDNLMQLCDLLPGLNILGDPNLTKMGKEIKKRLEGFDIEEMKKPKTGAVLKSAAAAEADEIVARMRGFMTAFGQVTDDE